MALPKFNLRDVFWLMVVVALGLGWWVDRSQLFQLAANTEQWRDRYEYLETYMQAQGYQVTLTRSPAVWTLHIQAPRNRPASEP